MIRYYICIGRECPTDSMMRLARGGVEARDYPVESVAWVLLSALYDSRIHPGIRYINHTSVEVSAEIGEFFWNTFTEYEDTGG